MSESHSSEQMLTDSSREMVLQCWRNVCRKTFIWKELPVMELMTIAVTASCCCVSWCGGSDTLAVTSVVFCRSVRPACTWCVVPPAANAAPAAASWYEIVVAPDLRFSPRCFVLAAASEWCRMERRIAQRCSSRLWRESAAACSQ